MDNEKRYMSIDLSQKDGDKTVIQTVKVGSGTDESPIIQECKGAGVVFPGIKPEVNEAINRLQETEEMKELDAKAKEDLSQTMPEIKPYLESQTNVENIPVEQGSPRDAYADIFADSMRDLKNITQIRSYSEQLNGELRALTTGVFGKAFEEDDVANIYTKFKTLNKKDAAELSDSEIDFVLEGFNLNTKDLKPNVELDQYSFKKDIISLICYTEESNIVLEKAEAELAVMQEEFNKEMDDIIANIDLTEKLGEIAERLETEVDPEKKAQLQSVYEGMYASINLDIILNKIQTKGLKIIKKEAKKCFKKAQEKAHKQMENDTDNLYLNPLRLEQSLIFLFPEYEEGVRILLYLIYKKINKRRDIDAVTRNFINYFILNVNKMLKPEFDKEQMPVYHNIKKFVEQV